MNGTFGTVEVRVSAEALSRLANLTDVVERLSGSIAAAVDRIGHLAEAIAANGGGVATAPARAVADAVSSVSTDMPAAAPEPAAPSTQAEPTSTLRPSAPPPPPKPDRYGLLGRATDVWTAARRAILARDWPGGVPVGEILDKVNALPGKPITSSMVGIRAAGWGLRRPRRSANPAAADKGTIVGPDVTQSPPPSTAEAERQPDAAQDPRHFLDVSSQNLTPTVASPPPASFLVESAKPPTASVPAVAASAPRPHGWSAAGADVWPQDKIDRLRDLWATGMSTALIGKALGVSKNAVVGKASRIGLSRPSPILSAPVEFTEDEIAIFLANPNLSIPDLALLFPNRTKASIAAKRRTLWEQSILPALPTSPFRVGAVETLTPLPSIAPMAAGDDPPRSGDAILPADAPPPAEAPSLPWQMDTPSSRTRFVPTCGFIIGGGRAAHPCDDPAVTLDENGNRYQSGAGMWCRKHRDIVYTKPRPTARPEARV